MSEVIQLILAGPVLESIHFGLGVYAKPLQNQEILISTSVVSSTPLPHSKWRVSAFQVLPVSDTDMMLHLVSPYIWDWFQGNAELSSDTFATLPQMYQLALLCNKPNDLKTMAPKHNGLK